MAEPTKIDSNKILNLPMSDVYADYEWNSRSKDEIFAKGGPDEETDSDKIKVSIKLKGQDDPIVVRPNPDAGKRGERAYLVVTGFTRYSVIDELYKENVTIPKSPTGTIRAVVENLNEQQACGLNLRENTARRSLSAPDLAFAIFRYVADQSIVAASVAAEEVGVSQPHTNNLLRIMKGTSVGEGKDAKPGKVARMWKEMGSQIVSVMEMVKIAALPKEDQEVAFTKLYDKKKNRGGGGINVWTKTSAAAAAHIGAMLGVLEKEGHADVGDMITWDDAVKLVGIRLKGNEKQADNTVVKRDATPQEMAAIVKAFKDGFTLALAGRPLDEAEALAVMSADDRKKYDKAAADAAKEKAAAEAAKAKAAEEKEAAKAKAAADKVAAEKAEKEAAAAKAKADAKGSKGANAHA